MSGIDLIREERRRQRRRTGNGEYYSLNHDDEHDKGELASAAAVYAIPPDHRARNESAWRAMWPAGWHFKPSPDDRIRELVKAGALIAAEIDRLQRAASSEEANKFPEGDPVEVHPSDSRAESQAGSNGPSGSPTSPSGRAASSEEGDEA